MVFRPLPPLLFVFVLFLAFQERDAMVCSAEVWAGRGPSPARKRRHEENSPPTPLHASVGTPQSASAVAGTRGGCWRRPLPSLASINVRLLDAAVQVFAASFGLQVRRFLFLVMRFLLPSTIATMAIVCGFGLKRLVIRNSSIVFWGLSRKAL